METGKVSILIVTWNSKSYLGDCLESVHAQTHVDREIIIVDNGSVDGTPDLARQACPDARLVRFETNQGFARGNNAGIAEASGEYIMTLNSDVTLDPAYIERLIEPFRQDDRLGMAGGKLYRPGRKLLDSTGLILSQTRRFFDRGSEEEDRGQYDAATDIFGACAAAAIYRRSMLEDVRVGADYFDGDFFAYVEDVDLAWRAKRRGWKARFVPGATAVHIRGASKTRRRLIQALSFRNRYWMMLKNDRISDILRDAPLLLPYDATRFLYMALTNPRTLPALLECLLKAPRMIRKRQSFVTKHRRGF